MPEMLDMQIADGWLRLHRLPNFRRAPVIRLETGDQRCSSFDDLTIDQLREIHQWAAAAIAEVEAEQSRAA
jgi:hypothetical protein